MVKSRSRTSLKVPRTFIAFLIELAVIWAIRTVELDLNIPGHSFRLPEPPTVEADRCLAVPDTVIDEIQSNLLVGRQNRVGIWYDVRLDAAELSDWVAVATTPEFEPTGYWVAANVKGSHSYWIVRESEEWQHLNSFDRALLHAGRRNWSLLTVTPR